MRPLRNYRKKFKKAEFRKKKPKHGYNFIGEIFLAKELIIVQIIHCGKLFSINRQK